MKLLPILLLSLGLPGFDMQTDEPRKLVVEANHSNIQFSLPIAYGIIRITGKFNTFSIDIELVDDDITKSQITATIQVKSIDPGIPGRDEDLMTKTFFDTEQFPVITFTSEQIVKNENGYVARGQFQMHGITKSIELPFKITGKSGENTVGFTSRYSIKSSDFNLATEFKHTSIDNFIGDEIGIEIDFWTKKGKGQEVKES